MLRIRIYKRERSEVGLCLAGNVSAADIPEVARLIEEARGSGVAIGIHLSAVRIIARVAVQFPVKPDGQEAEVTGCPRYVRE